MHEWFLNYAGSEKCVESFNNIWKDADIYSLVDFLSENDRASILKGKFANTSFIQRLPFAKTSHRNYLMLFPFAIEQFDLSRYDTVLSSSHAVAKGVLTKANQLHICYCHTPMRYAWDLYHQYLKESGLETGLKALIVKYMLHRIRIWDVVSANRVDYFIANSKYTSRRIKKTYGRDSAVIYPPVDVSKFDMTTEKEGYYFTLSRLVPYKKIDLIVEAFSGMKDKKLLVAGVGPEMKKIKEKAASNVEFIGYAEFPDVKRYMEHAKAFIYAAEEDFGITVVEALAAGTPVIAFGKGGTAESVQDYRNGLHFMEQTPGSIREAVKNFEKNIDKFDSTIISSDAQKFSRECFERNIKNFVDQKSEQFFNN